MLPRKTKSSPIFWLCLAAFFTTLLLGQNWEFALNHVLTSSKENVSLAFVEKFAQDFSLSIALPVHFQDPILQTALTPRDAAQLNNHVVPQTFPAVLIAYGAIAWLSKYLLIFVTPLIFSLIIFFYYRILANFFPGKIAFYSSVLLLLLPHFFYLGTSLISDDLLSLLFLLIGIDQFVRRKMPLAALSFGLAILFRLPNAIWVLPFILLALIKITDKKYFANWRVFVLSVGAFVIPISLIGSINFWLYEGLFVTGYSLQYPVIQQIVGSNTQLFSGGIESFLRQIFNYLILLYPIAFLLSLVGLKHLHTIYHLPPTAKTYLRPTIYYLLPTIYYLLLTWQYGGSIFWGHDQATLNSSFLRYTLPFYLILPFLSVLALQKFSLKNQKILGGILIVSFLLTTVFFRGGLMEKLQQSQHGQTLQKQILATTQTDTLILTKNLDKFIYPHRQVLILPILRQQKAFGYTNISPWEAPLDEEKIGDVLIKLHNNHYKILFLADVTMMLDKLNISLAPARLKLTKVWQINDVTALSLTGF